MRSQELLRTVLARWEHFRWPEISTGSLPLNSRIINEVRRRSLSNNVGCRYHLLVLIKLAWLQLAGRTLDGHLRLSLIVACILPRLDERLLKLWSFLEISFMLRLGTLLRIRWQLVLLIASMILFLYSTPEVLLRICKRFFLNRGQIIWLFLLLLMNCIAVVVLRSCRRMGLFGWAARLFVGNPTRFGTSGWRPQAGHRRGLNYDSTFFAFAGLWCIFRA